MGQELWGCELRGQEPLAGNMNVGTMDAGTTEAGSMGTGTTEAGTIGADFRQKGPVTDPGSSPSLLTHPRMGGQAGSRCRNSAVLLSNVRVRSFCIGEEPASGPSMQILVVWCKVDLWKLRLQSLPSWAGGSPF